MRVAKLRLLTSRIDESSFLANFPVQLSRTLLLATVSAALACGHQPSEAADGPVFCMNICSASIGPDQRLALSFALQDKGDRNRSLQLMTSELPWEVGGIRKLQVRDRQSNVHEISEFQLDWEQFIWQAVKRDRSNFRLDHHNLLHYRGS